MTEHCNPSMRTSGSLPDGIRLLPVRVREAGGVTVLELRKKDGDDDNDNELSEYSIGVLSTI